MSRAHPSPVRKLALAVASPYPVAIRSANTVVADDKDAVAWHHEDAALVASLPNTERWLMQELPSLARVAILPIALLALSACGDSADTGSAADGATGGVGDTGSDTDTDTGASASDAIADGTPPTITELATVPGDDDDLARDHLPIIWPSDLDDANYEDWDGFFIGFRHAIVVTKDDATVGQINAALSATGATITGALPGGVVLELRLDTADTVALAAVLEQLVTLPGIADALPDFSLLPDALPAHAADPNTLYRWDVPSYPAGPFDHGNWGLEAIRAPQLWNFDTLVRRAAGGTTISAGVVDAGFTEAVGTPTGAQHAGFLRANGTSVLQLVNSPIDDHGTHVAGIIGAPWDNRISVTGVDPWIDAILGRSHVFKWRYTTWKAQLTEISKLLAANPDLRAINNSYGLSSTFTEGDGKDNGQPDGSFKPATVPFPQYGGDAPIYKETSFDLDHNGRADTWSDLVKRSGDAYARQLANAAGSCMIVASAGNAGGFYQAADNSPINSAAKHHRGRFLSVESTKRDNTISSFSNVAGSVAAPGECIRSTEALGAGANAKKTNADADACAAFGDTNDPLYSTNRGTSMAAPHVTGLITALARLEPTLTVAQMRSLVTGDGTTVPTGGTRRIDAFAAALAIDGLKGNKALQTALVDVDDGTPDGNLRATLGAGGFPSDFTAVNGVGNRRGDGVVSMRDFRAYRDALAWAIAQANPTAANDVLLDGSPTHFKRDLNFDGCIFGVPVDPAHPTGGVPVPASCDGAPDEAVFSRYDFNGDGALSHGTSGFRGNQWRDIDVLMDLWPEGDALLTEGWSRADLPRLLPAMNGSGGSADLVLTADVSPPSPYDEIRVRVDGATGERVLDASTPELIWTVPRVGGVSAVRAIGLKGGVEVDALCPQDDTDGLPLSVAEDRPVRLLACGDSSMQVDDRLLHSIHHYGPPAYVGTQAGAPVIDLELGSPQPIAFSCPPIPVGKTCFVERGLPFEYATGTLRGRVTRTSLDSYSVELSAVLDPSIPPFPDPGGPGCGGVFDEVNQQFVSCESYAVPRVTTQLTVQTEISHQSAVRVQCGLVAETTVTGLDAGNTFAEPNVEIGARHRRLDGQPAEITDCFQQRLDTHLTKLDWQQTATVAAESSGSFDPGRSFTLRLTTHAQSARLLLRPDDDRQTLMHLTATATAKIDVP